jgi:hypothetical protein
MKFDTAKLSAYAQQYSLPDYVKTARTCTFDQLSDPRNRAACYLSKFAALTGQPNISERERCKRAEILNIGDDIEHLEQTYREFEQASQTKTAAPTEQYPIRSKDELSVAAWWLSKNAHALPLDERRDLGRKLLKKADEFGVTLPEEIEKFAGVGSPDLNILRENLIKRAELVKHARLNSPKLRADTAEALNDLALAVRVRPQLSLQTESLDKLATAMQFIDNEYGFHGHYGAYIDPPDVAAYPHSQKTGAEIEKYAYELFGDVYDIRDFENIKLAEVLETLGPDYVTAMTSGLSIDVEKTAEMLDAMDELETSIFVDIVKSAGIQPKFRPPKTVNLAKLAEFF